jgi:hypothetical protein
LARKPSNSNISTGWRICAKEF